MSWKFPHFVMYVKLTIHLHPVQRSKNVWSYTSTPPIRLHGVVLTWHRDNFTFSPTVIDFIV
jgi:hypothetical protein